MAHKAYCSMCDKTIWTSVILHPGDPPPLCEDCHIEAFPESPRFALGARIITLCPYCGGLFRLETLGGQYQEVYQGKCGTCAKDLQVVAIPVE